MWMSWWYMFFILAIQKKKEEEEETCLYKQGHSHYQKHFHCQLRERSGSVASHDNLYMLFIDWLGVLFFIHTTIRL
jgi:hypothetical protein